MAYIEFDHVVKEYPSGSSVIRALDEASMMMLARRIKAGEPVDDVKAPDLRVYDAFMQRKEV